MVHKYTEEQVEYITKNVKGKGNAELTKMFNDYFKLNLTIGQIRGFKKNRKLSSGLDGRFIKGQEPWNKGEKKSWVGGEATQFKKGRMPHNYMPVGSVRVNSDGYADVKIADPNVWKAKHILIWEKHNGPKPEGSAILFGDRNKKNLDINNLILVTKEQLLIMNNNELIQEDTELTKTGVIIAEIESKVWERNREGE